MTPNTLNWNMVTIWGLLHVSSFSSKWNVCIQLYCPIAQSVTAQLIQGGVCIVLRYKFATHTRELRKAIIKMKSEENNNGMDGNYHLHINGKWTLI